MMANKGGENTKMDGRRGRRRGKRFMEEEKRRMNKKCDFFSI